MPEAVLHEVETPQVDRGETRPPGGGGTPPGDRQRGERLGGRRGSRLLELRGVTKRRHMTAAAMPVHEAEDRIVLHNRLGNAVNEGEVAKIGRFHG